MEFNGFLMAQEDFPVERASAPVEAFVLQQNSEVRTAIGTIISKGSL